jgi:hypothetical protein
MTVASRYDSGFAVAHINFVYEIELAAFRPGARHRSAYVFKMETSMDKATDEAGLLSLDELASRMTAYRERATAARRLAEAITDKRATTGLLAHAEEFQKKAEEIATKIVSLAHACHDTDDHGGLESAEAMKASRWKRG